jgi:hypothetical protein
MNVAELYPKSKEFFLSFLQASTRRRKLAIVDILMLKRQFKEVITHPMKNAKQR